MIARTEAGLHEPALLGREKDGGKTLIGEDEVCVLRSLPCCSTDRREAHVDELMNVQATLSITGLGPTALHQSRAPHNLPQPRQIGIHHLGQNLSLVYGLDGE